MPDTNGKANAPVDVVAEIPEAIRMRAESSLAVNAMRKAVAAKSTAKRPRIDYDWRVQPVPDMDVAGKFAEAITRYAKYRPATASIPHADILAPKGQVTARCGDPMWYVNDSDGVASASAEGTPGAYLGVRYSVRPFEGRSNTARLPGTAT
jgi:hypothetical protein